MVVKIRKGNAEDGGFIIYSSKDEIHITKRELEALCWIAMGFDNKAVSKRLGVSINTVRNHVYNITQKLGAKNKTNAVVIAVEKGLLSIEHGRGPGPFKDQYLYSVECRHAYWSGDVVWQPSQTIFVNHVRYEMDASPRCPICNEDVGLSIEWEKVRKQHPEYPQIPERGRKYDYNWRELLEEYYETED